MVNSIRQLHDIHAGQTIYVLAGGAQMDLYRPEYFTDRITIGVNWAYQSFPCRYTMARHIIVLKEFDQHPTDSTLLVYPEITCDVDGIPSPNVPGYTFRDELRQYGSTTLTAVDLSAYMGAARIVILGAEGYGAYRQDYPIPEDNQPWLNRSRYELEQLIDLLQRTLPIRIDWVRFVP